MKTILAITVPVIALIGIACFAFTGTAAAADTAAQATAKPVSPVAHTPSRHCGDSCHHHGHYWSCGGCTYYCCGSH